MRGALVTGAAREPDAEAVTAGLARDIARLPPGKALIIAEFNPSQVTVWTVSLDNIGTPRIQRRRYDWPSFRPMGLLDEAELLDRLQPEDDGRLVLAHTGQKATTECPADSDALDAERAFRIARGAYPRARAFSVRDAVDGLLDEATARVPLPPSLWYELVLLRRSQSGRLEFTAQQLFLPEARRGDSRPFTVSCEPGDENGTVFAVVARDAAFQFKLVSLLSAKIPPGLYDLTATLLRPGRVRFDGLPVTLRADPRTWMDVLAAVPERLDVRGPAHLIVAVETCGTSTELETRIDQAERLIADVESAADSRMAFSLLTYGAHTHNRLTGEEPVKTVAWAEPTAAALGRHLRHLRTRSSAQGQPPRAAQLECMLAEVARRLRGQEMKALGRPALVTIGTRPAFPFRIDPISEILPCPRRHDWRVIWRGLTDDHAGIAFGAIRDDINDADDLIENPANEIWRHLGTDMSTSPHAFNAHAFAIGLGVVPPALQFLPFPLAIHQGAD